MHIHLRFHQEIKTSNSALGRPQLTKVYNTQNHGKSTFNVWDLPLANYSNGEEFDQLNEVLEYSLSVHAAEVLEDSGAKISK